MVAEYIRQKDGMAYTYEECLEHPADCWCDGCGVYSVSNYKFAEAKGIELTYILRMQKDLDHIRALEES